MYCTKRFVHQISILVYMPLIIMHRCIRETLLGAAQYWSICQSFNRYYQRVVGSNTTI